MTQAGAVVFSREGLRCGRSTIPSHKMVSRRCTGAMQPRMLLIVALVALLASARADEGEGSLLLGSMQGYMEQASKTVQDALSSMQESDIAVVARGWMDNRFKSLKGYWSKFTDKFTGLWESGPEDQLTTPTLEP